MSKFTNRTTGVVVTVADHKDERYSSELWEVTPTDDEPEPAVKARPAASKK